MSDNDVVDEFDSEELTGSDEVASDADVGIRWRGFSAGVIGHTDRGRRVGHDGHSEYIARMHEQGVHGSDAHQLMTADASAGIEDEDREILALGIEVRMCRNVLPPILGRFLRRVAKMEGLRKRAFAQ